MANWRMSSANGVLIAAYFIPTWLLIAYRIMVSPIHAFYERPNISVAIFLSDYFHLAAIGAVRAAWLLALAKVTVAAFFAVFLALLTRPAIRKSGGCDEALAIALSLGSVISFASMLMASQAGEMEAMRLHATELLLLLGTGIVMLVEKPAVVAVPAAQSAEPAPITNSSRAA